jgi:hypothetical protein
MTAKATVPSAAILASQLAARGSEAAPAHLVQTLTASAGAAAKGTFIGAIAQKAGHTMTWIKIKMAATIIAAVGVAGAGTGTLVKLAADHETPPAPMAAPNPPAMAAAAAALAPPAVVVADPNGPTAITLHVNGADARDVLQQIARQGHVKCQVWPDYLWSGKFGNPTQRVTLNIDNLPFWMAIGKLCAATDSNVMEMGDKQAITIGSSYHGNATGLAGVDCQSGMFTVVANTIGYSRSCDLNDATTSRNVGLSMTVFVDPKIRLVKYPSRAGLDAAQDDQGISMLDSQNNSADDPAFSLMNGPNFNLYATLKYSPHLGRELTHLAGHFQVMVVGGATPMVIHDISHSIGKSVSYKYYHMTLDSYSYINGSGSVLVTVSSTNSHFPWGHADNDLRDKVDGAISIVDGTGRVIALGGGGSGDQIHTGIDFTDENWHEPVTLIWNVPTEIKTVTVPFEFKNLLLPQE